MDENRLESVSSVDGLCVSSDELIQFPSMSDVPTFASLGLSTPLLETLTQLGYEAPTPIQARTIPALLKGRDLIGQAQTGTGKTAAFALPILQQLDLSSRV